MRSTMRSDSSVVGQLFVLRWLVGGAVGVVLLTMGWAAHGPVKS